MHDRTKVETLTETQVFHKIIVTYANHAGVVAMTTRVADIYFFIALACVKEAFSSCAIHAMVPNWSRASSKIRSSLGFTTSQANGRANNTMDE